MRRRIVTAGDRVYLKYFDLQFFHDKAKEADAELVPFKEMDDRRFKEAIASADALVVIDRPIRKDHLSVMTRCRIIQALEVGYDFIDVETATERGIIVSNVPAYGKEQVAIHALTLLLACHRKIKQLMSETSSGGWDYNVCKPIPDLSTLILGIVGLGKIGRALAPRAQALGLKVLAYDPYLDDDIFELLDVGRRYDFEEILSGVDFLSLHVPLTAETFHMIGERELELLKPGAILINTCRGKVVEEQALYRALQNGRLSGAGLDVLASEPPEADNPLLHCGNVIITPHAAWYSEQSTQRLKEQGMEEVVRVLNGARPRYVINPEVLLQQRAEQARK
ncbi:MAG: C-terminal binding protein [Spirochaetaceae bacterium]|nr:MAG: C-terminal binding protein [Spirochaetaceae bacterium]